MRIKEAAGDVWADRKFRKELRIWAAIAGGLTLFLVVLPWMFVGVDKVDYYGHAAVFCLVMLLFPLIFAGSAWAHMRINAWAVVKYAELHIQESEEGE